MSKNARRNSVPPFSISQNFLTSLKTIQRLLCLTSICENDHVIEIGAGKGHITKELVKTCRMVSAYEIDRKLSEQLRKKLRSAGNVTVKNHDFLKASLPEKGPYKIFSNIPFSITSDIMRKLTAARNPPQEAWLVMEKGAAMRFMGKPFDTLASTLIKPYFDAQIDYYFSRYDFHPAPAVNVALLHLIQKTQPDIPKAQQKSFADFVEKSLRHGVNSQLTKRQIAAALRAAGLPHIQESGTMLYVQWLCLFRCRQRYGG